MLVASFIRDTACTMISEPAFEVQAEDEDDTSDSDGVPAYVQQANTVASEEINANDTEIAALQDALVSSYEDGWPQQARAWRQDPEKDEMIGQLMPGMWMNPLEYGRIPRLRLLQGWDPDLSHATLPFHPMCMSTRSKDPAFNLTPSANDGWEHWVHPDYQDKPYLMTRTPGAKVTFQLETVLGVVKMYSLKSKTFGLGTIECWADEDRSESVKIEGYWDNGNACVSRRDLHHQLTRSNIGRFDTIRTDLEPGSHAISCQLLEETADPGGGHEFRMISIMRWVALGRRRRMTDVQRIMEYNTKLDSHQGPLYRPLIQMHMNYTPGRRRMPWITDESGCSAVGDDRFDLPCSLLLLLSSSISSLRWPPVHPYRF